MTKIICLIGRQSYVRPFVRFGLNWVALILIWSGLFPTTLFASTDDEISAICASAANEASRQTGVPLSILRTISLTETGRRLDGAFQPWPWTVNMEGKGVWFDSRIEALKFVEKNMTRGALSFDVGCFQLNYKWHGQNFKSVQEMFDPLPNAIYAANFLKSLYEEKGNWPSAAGAYHSRTPKYAQRYIARFNRILASLGDPPPTVPVPSGSDEEAAKPAIVARVNRFPLLQGAGSAHASLGSLMPATAGSGGTSLFGGG